MSLIYVSVAILQIKESIEVTLRKGSALILLTAPTIKK